MVIAIIFAGLAICAAVIAWIWDRRALSREYQEMEHMTPEQAHRRALVLKYLPQSDIEMKLIEDAIARGEM